MKHTVLRPGRTPNDSVVVHLEILRVTTAQKIVRDYEEAQRTISLSESDLVSTQSVVQTLSRSLMGIELVHKCTPIDLNLLSYEVICDLVYDYEWVIFRYLGNQNVPSFLAETHQALHIAQSTR